MLSIRVPQAGILTDFYKEHGFLASIFYNISSYFICTQFLGHLIMAFNRFTLLWFPFKHYFFWKRSWYIYVLIILPLLPICYRLHEPGNFIFTKENTVVVTLINANLMSLTFVISSVLYVSSTCIVAILNLLSLIKFPSNTHNRNERDLLRRFFFQFLKRKFQKLGRKLLKFKVFVTF